jgi:hypothetical protein
MSAGRVTPEDDPGPEPTRFVDLDIGPGVLVFAERDYVGGVWSRAALDLTYEGYQDELLSAAIITEAMLVPPGNGHHYCDPNGRNVRISRRWRAQYGKPLTVPYLKVTRHMSTEELPRWPQGREALAAHDRYHAWSAAYSAYLRAGRPVNASSPLESSEPAATSAAAKPRPAFLRLVIDNTEPQP